MSDRLSESAGTMVKNYPWLVVDGFMLVLLGALFLGYSDFDTPMRLLLRGALVLFWTYLFMSGLHLLVYVRVAERGGQMRGTVSYSLFFLKAVLMFAFLYWANYRELL